MPLPTDLPRYLKSTALGAAVDAYDAARVRFHQLANNTTGIGDPMSDANKDTIAPMIMEAIVAWERSVHGDTELRGGLLT